MRKVNYYSNILKKGTYFSFIIPSVNNIYCADNPINKLLLEYKDFKDTKDDFIKKLINNNLLPEERYWERNKFEYNINTVLDAINKYEKKIYETNEAYNKTYKEYIETFKKHYLLCYFKEEISKENLLKLVDKDNKQIFTEEDFNTYNKNKKIIEENEEFIRVKENIPLIYKSTDDGGFSSSEYIYDHTYSEKYKEICSSHNTFYINIYFYNYSYDNTNYDDIYIKVRDYGYPNDDIKKEKGNIILKNLKDLDKVRKNTIIKPNFGGENKHFSHLREYIKFTEDNEETFKKIIDFNENLSKEINEFKEIKNRIFKKVKDGDFNINEKIENDKIENDKIENIKKEIDEISNKKYDISSMFDHFIDEYQNGKVRNSINFENYKDVFSKCYIGKRDNLINDFKTIINDINNSITDLTEKINDFKTKINKLKNKINDLNKINNILKESKNTDINKYNDNFFNILFIKDLTNCEDSINLLEKSINDSFYNQKISLKTKYDGIKNLNDSIQKVENNDYKFKIDSKYDTGNFFENLTIDNINTIETEINKLEEDVKKAKEDYNKALQEKLEKDKKDKEKAEKIKEAEDKKTVIKCEIEKVCNDYLSSIKDLTIDENFDKSTISTDLDNKINELYSDKKYNVNDLTGWEDINKMLLTTIQQLKSDCISKCNDEINKKLKEIADKKAKDLEEQQKKEKEEEEQQRLAKEEAEKKAKEEQDKLNNNNNNNNNEEKQNIQNKQQKEVKTNTGKNCSEKCSKNNKK